MIFITSNDYIYDSIYVLIAVSEVLLRMSKQQRVRLHQKKVHLLNKKKTTKQQLITLITPENNHNDNDNSTIHRVLR